MTANVDRLVKVLKAGTSDASLVERIHAEREQIETALKVSGKYVFKDNQGREYRIEPAAASK